MAKIQVRDLRSNPTNPSLHEASHLLWVNKPMQICLRDPVPACRVKGFLVQVTFAAIEHPVLVSDGSSSGS